MAISSLDELLKSGSVYWFCALMGSGMFLIQFLVNLFGFADQENVDTNQEIAPAETKNFRWLSLQTLTGFLMLFGWTALTCQKQFGLQSVATLTLAVFAGSAAALMVRFILKLSRKLKSSGNVYRIEEALGKEAYVYQCIPKGGKGKVSLSIQQLTHEIDAISDHEEDLPSFVRVQITRKIDDHTVVVKPL